MDKKEAYRICHVYPDREIPFVHKAGSVIYEGLFRRLTDKECETYYPFTVETEGIAKLADTGKITCHDIGRRYKTMEDAVVHIFNMHNENCAIKNRYSSLEDILFK
jgi:hypothetical protein